MKNLATLSVTLSALFVFALTGCPSNSTQPTDSITPTASESSGPTDMEKMKTELAKLSPEDAAAAEKQHVCPVSGKMLGTMGTPQKVDVNGQQVWICCDGCKDELLAKPEEYLAKLKN